MRGEDEEWGGGVGRGCGEGEGRGRVIAEEKEGIGGGGEGNGGVGEDGGGECTYGSFYIFCHVFLQPYVILHRRSVYAQRPPRQDLKSW